MFDKMLDSGEAMEEDFATLLEESFKRDSGGRVTNGVIVSIKDDFVTIDVGEKIEGRISVSEITGANGELTYKVGDKLPVTISGFKNERPMISHKNAIKAAKQKEFVEANKDYETREIIIQGKVTKENKGGYIIEDGSGMEFFMPKSQAGFKKDEKAIGKSVSGAIIKVDGDANSVVISRLKLIKEKQKIKRDVINLLLEDPKVHDGVIKSVATFGVFVEVDGVEGLVRYDEISFKGPVNPITMFQVGQSVAVKPLSYDKDKNRLSFSIKAAMNDPWEEIKNELEVGDTVKTMVSNIEDYGAFLDLGNDIEGFLHISEMSWRKNLKHPSEVIAVGQELTVEITEIDLGKRKLRMSLKKLLQKPFESFKQKHKVGDVVKGKVVNTTDFGAFIELGEVEGLLHNEDASWSREFKCKENLKVGDEIEVKIVKIDHEKEKISLSLKELGDSPVKEYSKTHAAGDVVVGIIRDIKDFGVFVELVKNVDGLIPNDELYPKKKEELAKGEEIECSIINISPESGKIRLSVKKIEKDREKDAVKKFNSQGESESFSNNLKEKLS
jgi:small subunit ribosomal protein S1